jgi:methylthioribulose-1-phosphate dehydratase
VTKTFPETARAEAEALLRCVARARSRGWCEGTGGNFSVVVSRKPLQLLVTPSGADKADLRTQDLLLVGADAAPAEGWSGRPSDEAPLHVAVAERTGAGAIVHTHSVWGTLLGERFGASGGFRIRGYEMLKGLAGVRSHEQEIFVPVVANSQDMAELGAAVRRELAARAGLAGLLIAGHGLYAWGAGVAEARRHLEIFEFLFEVVGRRASLEPFTG